MPLLGWAIYLLLKDYSLYMAIGFVVALATPTTVASNTVFTAAAGGNEPLALVNAVLGNVIGIFITPAWLKFLLPIDDIPSMTQILISLSYQVIVPCVIGQLVALKFPVLVGKFKKLGVSGYISCFMLILIVYSTFSETFASDVKVEGKHIALVGVLDLLIYLAFTFGCLGFPYFTSITRADAIAISYVAATKTVSPNISYFLKQNVTSSMLGITYFSFLIPTVSFKILPCTFLLT